MTQLSFLNGQSKAVKVIVYLILAALITGYAGASGWVFTQVMNRPIILESYQKKADAINQEVRFKEALVEHKANTFSRIDRLEDYMTSRFNRLEDMVLKSPNKDLKTEIVKE